METTETAARFPWLIEEPRPAADGSAPAIVVIDDQATSRAALTRIVKSIADDTDVRAFAVPSAALAFVEAGDPILIVTDYKMPGIDGLQLVRRLRSSPTTQHVPIIVVTVIEDRAVRQAALEAGATDFLTKPIDPDECRARCRNLLLMSRQQRLLREQCRKLETKLPDTRRLLAQLGDADGTAHSHDEVRIDFEKLYELTSSVTAAEQMLRSVRASIEQIELELRRPLHGRREPPKG